MTDDTYLDEAGAKGLSLGGEPLPVADVPYSAPLGHSPLRRADSIRRTMSLDVTWPDGYKGLGVIAGRCRDVVTRDPASDPQVIGDERLDAQVRSRTLQTLSSMPPRPTLDRLAGARAGGHLRMAIDDVLPGERAAATPLYLMLDDLAGVTLVSRWAWSRWFPEWTPGDRNKPEGGQSESAQNMIGVCMGFRPGSTAVDAQLNHISPNVSTVEPLPHPDDPAGWHDLPDVTEIHFRRARRIDAWREDGVIHVDSTFQDSASNPDGGARSAIHEYRLTATADAQTRRLLTLNATPGTLPYRECPAAPMNLRALIGVPMDALRDEVLAVLRRTNGCTHLNDALRALAEVPQLLTRLP